MSLSCYCDSYIQIWMVRSQFIWIDSVGNHDSFFHHCHLPSQRCYGLSLGNNFAGWRTELKKLELCEESGSFFVFFHYERISEDKSRWIRWQNGICIIRLFQNEVKEARETAIVFSRSKLCFLNFGAHCSKGLQRYRTSIASSWNTNFV